MALIEMTIIHSCGTTYIAHRLHLDSRDLSIEPSQAPIKAIADLELHSPVNAAMEIAENIIQ